MTDSRFYQRSGPFSLGDIARAIAAEPLDGQAAAILVEDVASLEEATSADLSVLTDARYREAATATRAGAIITSRELAASAPAQMPLLLVVAPRLAFAQAGHLFYPAPPLIAGTDPAARVHPSAGIGAGTQIDAGVVVGAGAAIGSRCHIAFNTVIGDGVVIGDDCRIGANVTISHTIIGNRVSIEPGNCIGGPGFGFVPGPKGLLRMLQLGRVIIEDNVEIGANCAIDRGAADDTVIGAGTVFDNLVHIAHNVRIGRNCVICGQVGIAGSSIIGDGVMMGGQVGIADHLRIGAGAQIAAASGVIRNIEAGAKVGGYPAVPLGQWHRQNFRLNRLVRRESDKTDESR